MKLFIIAPHFPPSSLPPSQRVRLMTRHLADLGIEASVFTIPHKYREEIPDEWMVELAGTNFKKIEVRAFPQKWTRKIGIGDLGLRWIPFLFPRLLFKTIKEKPDFILYPVPPWYLLTIAPIIKFLTGVKYGIDFIDPWVEGTKLPDNATFKRKSSQLIARKLEGWVCRNASVIYSVSEGINKDIVNRHPKLNNIPFYAIPYGVESGDFAETKQTVKTINNVIQLKHIGAVSTDISCPVLETLICALKAISTSYKIQIEFIGTNYAEKKIAQPLLLPYIKKNNANDIITEYPDRVTYKRAVELTLSSDILLLFGGMQPYYAASKLMGLVASQKPFIAFLHRETFPCWFLEQFNYPYLVKYSHHANDFPSDHFEELNQKIILLLNNYVKFVGLDLSDERIRKNTAKGMTQQFIEPLRKILNVEN